MATQTTIRPPRARAGRRGAALPCRATAGDANGGGVAAALDVAVTAVVAEDPLPGLPPHATRQDAGALRLLRSLAAQHDATGSSLLAYVNDAVQRSTPEDPDNDTTAAGGGVQLMTVHQAKGLEADAVHVVGLQDGEFPMKRGDVDEEVRVLYVALTRARRYLGWTRGAAQRPSRLLPATVTVTATFSGGAKKSAGAQ